ncbi:MAG: hypothetical protein RL448_217, partial [Actinomycetota bacterium]
MFKSIAIAATTYEPGMIPGEGMSAVETALWFFVAPTVLFVVISLLTWAGTAKKRN